MLFDNDNMEIGYNFFDLAGLNNNYNNMNTSNNLNLLSSKEGFLKGNMFKDEYRPYKNLTYININPKSDREAKLYTVMQYAFAINDLNLYLDVHPEDMEALNVLKKLIKEEENAKNEYINNYGPLDICDVKGNSFDWINSPWSWEKLGGNMYV